MGQQVQGDESGTRNMSLSQRLKNREKRHRLRSKNEDVGAFYAKKKKERERLFLVLLSD